MSEKSSRLDVIVPFFVVVDPTASTPVVDPPDIGQHRHRQLDVIIETYLFFFFCLLYLLAKNVNIPRCLPISQRETTKPSHTILFTIRSYFYFSSFFLRERDTKKNWCYGRSTTRTSSSIPTSTLFRSFSHFSLSFTS